MSHTSQPVLIGEVLFDLFDDGQAILGGAPFNVAWHLQGFGEAPMFISRIGQDEYGEKINKTIQDWGMSTAGLQLDTLHTTGKVDIKLNHGQASFDICDDVAYDYIDIRLADEALTDQSIPVLYHGSLAARHDTVYDAILQMRQASEISFVDINLRPPWWDKQRVAKLMHGASCLKVNDDELIQLSNINNTLPAMIGAARVMLQEFNVDSIILTLGDRGALIINADEVEQGQPVKVNELKDTVGAGDAFSSICILGMLHGWDTTTMLQRAMEFAAKICQQHGATQINHKLYESLRQKWQLV